LAISPGRPKYFGKSFDLRASAASVSAPRTGWQRKAGEKEGRISNFPLAVTEMVARVADPISKRVFSKNVAQILQNSR
jgi:hypothetical protein